MKKDKLMDAFKAFEIKNKDVVKGGYYYVSWTNGTGRCDILNSETGQEYCNQLDNYTSCGPAMQINFTPPTGR
ncbi:MAG: hypothetical protein IT215_07670 [Chitinophagaceae bacterium]|nr:hypothetical protein [Chitinophagaceae bacterium]